MKKASSPQWPPGNEKKSGWENKEDEKKWDDDTVYDAICEWDDKFADDPNWFDEEDTDVKDSLRDRVCIHLGLGEFKKEEDCECGGEYEECTVCEDKYKCSHCGLCECQKYIGIK